MRRNGRNAFSRFPRLLSREDVTAAMSTFQTLTWLKEKKTLRLLDQRRLPTEELFLECKDLQQVTEAIKTLAVRGAPAIGVAAAYGVVVGVQEAIAAGNSLTAPALTGIISPP